MWQCSILLFKNVCHCILFRILLLKLVKSRMTLDELHILSFISITNLLEFTLHTAQYVVSSTLFLILSLFCYFMAVRWFFFTILALLFDLRQQYPAVPKELFLCVDLHMSIPSAHTLWCGHYAVTDGLSEWQPPEQTHHTHTNTHLCTCLH